jgi:hypothetical protein
MTKCKKKPEQMRIINGDVFHNYRLPSLRSLGTELLKPLKKVAAARKLV